MDANRGQPGRDLLVPRPTSDVDEATDGEFWIGTWECTWVVAVEAMAKMAIPGPNYRISPRSVARRAKEVWSDRSGRHQR